jgi:multidrug efflux pump subunit AcrA (membrane-fusion protein)
MPKEEEVLPPPLVERQTELNIETAEAARGDIADVITVNGVFTAADQTAYYFDAEGLRLMSLNVKPGDTVKAGTLIAQADPGDLDYRIQVQKNNVRLAEIRLEQSTRREKETRQLELDNEKLSLNHLEEQLEQCSLYAAQDGVVLFADNIKEGEIVPAFRVLARVAAPGGLVAYAQSDSLKAVHSGMPAQMTVDGAAYSGKVTMSSDNVPDTADVRYKNAVFVTPQSQPEGIAMGAQVRLQIILSQSQNALLVPERALRTALGQNYVQVLLEDGTRKEYDVEVGILTATQAEILSGVSEGMRVILK